MTPGAGNVGFPVFVGSTTHLLKRLSNHAWVNKIYRDYNDLARVLVVGTVKFPDVYDAVNDLATRITTDLGYSVGSDYTSLVGFSYPLQHLGDYSGLQVVLNDWRDSWFVKTIKHSGNRKVLPNQEEVKVFSVGREQLMKWCEEQKYGSVQERNLVLNIAYNYNEHSGYSVYFPSESEMSLLSYKNKKATKIRKIYSFPTGLKVRKDIVFRVQASFIHKNL